MKKTKRILTIITGSPSFLFMNIISLEALPITALYTDNFHFHQMTWHPFFLNTVYHQVHISIDIDSIDGIDITHDFFFLIKLLSVFKIFLSFSISVNICKFQ